MTTTAGGSLAAALQQSSSLPRTNTTTESGNKPKTAVVTKDVDDAAAADADQLSSDLALFLSNPSLRAALADGSLDLASYSNTVERELNELESQCMAQYRSKATEIASLHADLVECQSVLARLREMLLGFQADLGGLSGEIRHLQERSRDLDVQLKNRKAAEGGLRNFLQHIVVAPNVAQALTTGPVNHVQFVHAVAELQQLAQNCSSSSSSNNNTGTAAQEWSAGVPPGETTAGLEMQGKVQTLQLLAVRRIRLYFLSQMALLRQPQTNVRMIQVHGLLQYAALQDFLYQVSPTVLAAEIYNVYLESMSKTLLQLFRTYAAQLLQLDATKTAATRQDVLAIEEHLLRDSLTTKAKKRVDVMCLGRRAIDCLGEDDDGEEGGEQPAPILAHVALAEGHLYPYERLFRSLLGHLVDAVTNEHVFCRQFFKRDGFAPLFSHTLSLLLEQLENYLFTCHDALCLLLMIKVSHYYKRITRQRHIFSLDAFFDHCTKLLWPRLKIVMEAHLRSLKQATAAKLGLSSSSSLQQHYVSRRFAEFCCSLLLILHNNTNNKQQAGSATPSKTAKASEAPPPPPPAGSPPQAQPPSHVQSPTASSSKSAGDMLLTDVHEMVEEFVALLERLAEEQGTSKKRIVFMINNLDHVVCIFQERRCVPSHEFNRFVQLLMRQRELFVEEELLPGFSKMIAFVQQTEPHLKGNNNTSSSSMANVNVQVVETLVLDFAAHWKTHIDVMNRNVLSYFSNFRNGMEILKQVLTQLLLYYTRFQDIIKKVWRHSKPPAFAKSLVPTTVILNEIKKHAMAI